MSVSLAFDPKTGDIIRDADGQVVYTDDPSPEIFLALGMPLGEFHGDPDQGSTLPRAAGGAPAVRSAALVPGAREAMRRLEAAGLVTVRDVRLEAGKVVTEADELADPFTYAPEE